jgi:hypothetical protein
MRRTLVVLSLLVALTGCDDDNNSPSSPTSPSPNPSGSPAATMALVSATCVPSIVPAVPSVFAGFAWQVSWVLDVRESAGINGRVNFLQVTIADQQVMFMDAAGIAAVAGSANVAARGALPIPLTLPYNLPDGGKLANVTATINFTDARGNVLVASGQLRTF